MSKIGKIMKIKLEWLPHVCRTTDNDRLATKIYETSAPMLKQKTKTEKNLTR